MKKLSLYVFLVLIWCNIGYAEKYVCSYSHSGEPHSIVLERAGKFFKKSNGVSDRIIFEDEYAIVLEDTYTLSGKQKAQTYTTLIDKKRLTFVFIGLEYQNNTPVSEGTCQLF
tara:strand:- start:694 stop:1032 length:339 start_codon:yes stop_codon:yes gene_type:complete